MIDDEALREAMKDRGLGTPATRAAIIETLLHRGYIARDKQHLVPTEMGIGLIDALPVASLASPELTGTWEARLARVARGEETRAAFMVDIARYVADLVDAIRAANPPPAPASAVIGACPMCRGEVRERRSDFGCACGFAIRKRIAGREVGVALAGVLLERRRSQVLRGFRSKAGKKFAAALVLDEAGEVRFAFESRADGGKDTGAVRHANRSRKPRDAADRVQPTGVAVQDTNSPLSCPRCRAGSLMAGSRGWGCTRWRDGCRFVVWFETAGRRLTDAQLRDLVTRGKTRKARFVAEGVEVAGRLVLDPAADGGARLERM
jgi:DNA topoisomerase-3